ncbi:hypothetical protein [Sinobaca sp. H24]|uniref:hypothetical protein n=1 Tax=Sinobaca sp. H24 TaxID=2923376 RepID=UPI0020798451|nr:hypothetical protein [Sinobaca sp. H24]
MADPEDVKKIEITVNPYVLELTGKKEPNTGLEGNLVSITLRQLAIYMAQQEKNSIQMKLLIRKK